MKTAEEALLAKEDVGLYGLVGMGGVGKTAIAIELAHRLRDRFPDGVLWLKLESRSFEEALSELAAQLSLEEVRGLPIPEQEARLRTYLGTREVLIVFDNAEDGNILNRLLDTVGQASLLVTSRDRLATDRVRVVDVECMEPDESVKLFLKAAGISKPSKDDRGTVDQICEFVGHLPQAVRLCASQYADLRMNLAEIESSLRERGLDALSPPSRTEESRSVRESFEITWAKLDPDLQKLFSACGVFAGPTFSEEAALATSGLKDGKGLIQRLVSLSLVQPAAEGRFGLHSLLRLYAREKLGHGHDACARAAEFFLGEIQAGRAIEEDVENYVGMAEWCFSEERWSDVKEMAWEVDGFLRRTRLWHPLVQILKLGVSACEKSGDKKTRAAFNNNLGTAYMDLPSATPEERARNVQRAIQCYTEALEIRKKDQYPVEYATTQNNLGNAYMDLPSATPEERARNLQRAIQCYNEALEIRKKDQYPVDYATTQNNLGTAYTDLPSATPEERARNAQRAIQCYTEALGIRKKDQYPHYYAHTAMNLGLALSDQGDLKEARWWLEEAYELRQFLSDQGRSLKHFLESLSTNGTKKGRS